MPATATKAKTDADKLQDWIDSIRYNLIVHNGRWDAIPSELRAALLNELAERTIRFRDKNDPACKQAKHAGELEDGEILLCPGLANEATLLHELVHAAGGQELDSEALENHLYSRQDSDPSDDDFPKFITESPCRYMDGKATLLVSKFVIWDPKSGDLWFQTGTRKSPKKGNKLSEGFKAPQSTLDQLTDSPPPRCAADHAQRCGAPCKDFDHYGYCDRKVYQPPCYQHRAAV